MQYGYEHRRSEFEGNNEISPHTLQEAELAFYDAMALYGHESAEALVAELIWKEQRRLLAIRIWQKRCRAEQSSKPPSHRQTVANDNQLGATKPTKFILPMEFLSLLRPFLGN